MDQLSLIPMLSSLPDLVAGIPRPYQQWSLLSAVAEVGEDRQLSLEHPVVEGEVVEEHHQLEEPEELE